MEQLMVVFVGFATAAAVAHVFVACLLLKVAGKQKDISRDQVKVAETQAEILGDQVKVAETQAGIMEAQTQLSRMVDESNKVIVMVNEYRTLSEDSRSFRRIMAEVYNSKMNELDIPVSSSFDKVILQDLPSDLPSKEADLRQYVHDNEAELGKQVMWTFLNYVWQRFFAIRSDLNDNRMNLVRFWTKWCSLLDVNKYVRYLAPDVGELVLLSWLELVTVALAPTRTQPEALQLCKIAESYLEWWQNAS